MHFALFQTIFAISSVRHTLFHSATDQHRAGMVKFEFALMCHKCDDNRKNWGCRRPNTVGFCKRIHWRRRTRLWACSGFSFEIYFFTFFRKKFVSLFALNSLFHALLLKRWISIELFKFILFKLEADEALLMLGAERYSNYDGYDRTFRWLQRTRKGSQSPPRFSFNFNF